MKNRILKISKNIMSGYNPILGIKIDIDIDYNNETMQDGQDAIPILKKYFNMILKAVENNRANGGRILDSNGNRVGEWEIDLK